jgi:hypothetical protein
MGNYRQSPVIFNRHIEETCNSYLRYKTGSNVFMDELVNYRSSPIGRDL